jgi:hypothetical protein
MGLGEKKTPPVLYKPSVMVWNEKIRGREKKHSYRGI